MIPITIPAGEIYDEKTNEFYTLDKKKKITLEHSLLSVSKWESKTHKSFFADAEKRTLDEMILYIQCMTLEHDVDPASYYVLKAYPAIMDRIQNYISDPMTATTFSDSNRGGRRSRKIVTSELIYYWMARYGIPFDPCEKWHLNRLMTLIRVCEVEDGPQKKMSLNKIYSQNADLNALRRAKLHSKG